jgi:hypothetical protein
MDIDIIETFNRDGVVFPVQIFNKDEISYYRSLLEYEIDHNNMMEKQYRCKSLLLYKWIDEIARNEKILNLVEQIIGPDFFCWDTQCWLKEPNDQKYVSWHQDATYWNFKVKNGVIVWLAFNDVDNKMGPVVYKLGSHKVGQYQHKDKESAFNLLTRGQTVNNEYKYNSEAELIINEGYISMHHPYVVHGSRPNIGKIRGIGYSLQYIPTNNISLIPDSIEYATLVSGKDEYNYIQHSPPPTGEINIDIDNWKIAFDLQRENYFRIRNVKS